MKELNVSEIEQVNGGLLSWLAGEVLSWAIRVEDWGDASDDWNTNLAP